MAEERIYIINLRKEFLKVARYKKSKKSIKAIKEYISKHMKVELSNVHIGRYLNLKIWERGMKNPPSKIKIHTIINEGVAYVELPEKPFVFKVEEKKEDKKKSEKKVIDAEVVENSHDHTSHAHKEDLKSIEKEELKEMKKEHNKEAIEKPEKSLKQNIKTEETKEKMSKTMHRSGKKEKG